MPVKISNPATIPAVSLDKLHVDSFTVRHAREDEPKRVINAVGVPYGQGVNGVKHFGSKSLEISTADFDSVVVTEYMTKNPGLGLVDFMAEYTNHKSALNTRYVNGEISTAELMASFELAIGVVFELLSESKEIEGIE